jgi:hypothetical protein
VTAARSRWKALAALGGLAVLLVAAGAAWQATRSSSEPRHVALLAFGTRPDRSGNGVVYVARPDGSQRRQIAAGSDPHLSPDGTLVAFAHVDASGGHVLVAPSAGGAASERYSAPPDRAFRVVGWLAGGRLLVARSDGYAIAGTDRSLERLLPAQLDLGAVGSLSISPDGGAVAFTVAGASGSDVYAAAATPAAKPVQLTTGGRSLSPVYGPEGIAWFRGGSTPGIWLLPTGATHPRLIISRPVGLPVAFDSTGEHLLAGGSLTARGQLWGIDVASGRARRLDRVPTALQPVDISSDGGTVLAATGCDGPHPRPGLVATFPFAGGPRHVIGRGPCSASWTA